MSALSAILPPGFHFIQNGHGLSSLAKKSQALKERLQKNGFSEKYCGPHAIGMALHFWSPKIRPAARLFSCFDPVKVTKEGTTPSELAQALQKITGVFFSIENHVTPKTIDALIADRKPVIALMKIRENPLEYHWITLVGASDTQYSSLNYEKVELISKDVFADVCSLIVYPEAPLRSSKRFRAS